jgi:ectoine hydroxylase-related dioxygenase (phytanoyl-CoA dioxygenase family)
MLSREQLRQFDEDGFLVVEDLLDHQAVLAPLVAEYEAVLDRLRQRWIADGELDPNAPANNFQERILSAYAADLDYFQPLDISLPGGEIAADTPFHAGPAAFNLLMATALIDAVEALIGPEITSNPIQHVRIKPPATLLDGAENRAHITHTDWHQDRGVTLPEADETRMITAWIAITDATVENGCLQVIPGSHRGGMLLHCPLPQTAIAAGMVDGTRARALPVRAGGVILFHPLTIHGSLVNRSRNVRWSFDLRYIATGDPTGRPFFPSFVARSRRAPETVLDDASTWRQMWEETRTRLAGGEPMQLHRWSADASHCA